MANWSNTLDIIHTQLIDLKGAGVIHKTIEDHAIDGRVVHIDGQKTLNFGSCSYLGLEMNESLKAGAIDAINRYGTQFSSSRSYLETPLYQELEGLLNQITGGYTIVAPTTTLAHMAALPALIDERDAVFVDHQAHASIQNVTGMLKVRGTPVKLLRHNAIEQLEARLEKMAGSYRKIWYLADGIYSMYGDVAPMAELTKLQERYPNFHLYIDDAHGFSWTGQHGRGYALDVTPLHPQTVVAASLSKGFGGGGGMLVCPDQKTKDWILGLGGPLIFGGPLQPAVLGTNIASAKLHLTSEFSDLQKSLREKIVYCNRLMLERGLPLVDRSDNPIRFLGMGPVKVAKAMIAKLIKDGYWLNMAVFPAVSMKNAGVRFTITNHLTKEDIRKLVDSIAKHLPAALEETGHSLSAIEERFGLPVSTPSIPTDSFKRSGLTLEHASHIANIDSHEWNSLLADRGSFDADSLAMLEKTHNGTSDADRWRFHYYVVRDSEKNPVLATFFTDSIWKNDVFSAAEVSRVIEQERLQDPRYQTSRVFSMGSLLTEGDHLYVDKRSNWRVALNMLLQAVRAEAKKANANTVIFRDLSESQGEVGQYLLDEGFARSPLPNSMHIELDGSEEKWLMSLSSRQRHFIRKEVYPRRDNWVVRVVDAENPMDQATHDHLFGLYENVKNKSLRLNSFSIPKNFLTVMSSTPGWELILLYPKDPATGLEIPMPAAFGACLKGESHYLPLLAGLDYNYVKTHGAYRQLLYRMVMRALALGLSRVHMGMDAELEKRRVGAKPKPVGMYFQTEDAFAMDELANMIVPAKTIGRVKGTRPNPANNSPVAA